MSKLLNEVKKIHSILGLESNSLLFEDSDKGKSESHINKIIVLLKSRNVYSAQIQKSFNKIVEYSKDQIIDFNLLERGIIKTLNLKGDEVENVLEFLRQLLKSLKTRDHQIHTDEPEIDDVPSFELEEPSNLPKNVYKEELYYLQVELLKLQNWLNETGKTVIIVFEGRDSAGKGSSIKKFVENLNPRYFNIIALGIPTPEERQDWFGRYSNKIKPGMINFFDRSWYNRGLVEPVMGYGTEEEYEDFMDKVGDFEESLVENGDYLFKLWFSIDKETQKTRFDMRQANPLKQWKYSPNDAKMQDLWDRFTEFKERLFDKTSTINHPWVVLDSNDKRISGLNAIRYVLKDIPYANKNEKVLDKEFPEAMQVLRPNKNIEEQYTQNKNDINLLKTYKEIKFPSITGDTQPLGLSKIETPETLIQKINKNFSVPVFRLNSAGFDFPVYRLEGKYTHNGKTYIIDFRPETGNNFALIGTIKLPIKSN